ncbi:MAG: thymidine kinase [Clostridiales bacterium]|nr:thymidine kinase [Clostridiales bacterium]
MNKLYFRYGAMGSSKTAQALMIKFNYQQKGFNVFLFKPICDNRCQENGKSYVSSRIGLKSECLEFTKEDNFFDICQKHMIVNVNKIQKNVIIVDECQFLTKSQVEELKELSLFLPVLCFGLLTNYKTELFEGSKRLIELADSINEIKSVCRCGRKATINARLNDGKIVCEGEEIVIGGDDRYEGMCYHCYKTKLNKQNKGS